MMIERKAMTAIPQTSSRTCRNEFLQKYGMDFWMLLYVNYGNARIKLQILQY